MTQSWSGSQWIDARLIMAPSLLKKMSGSKERVEGNYASSDLFPSLGPSPHSDLGLTLLPGSQTQKGNEDRTDSVSNSEPVDLVSHNEQRQTAAEQSKEIQAVCRSGRLENHEAPSYSTTALIRSKSLCLTDVTNVNVRHGYRTPYNDCSAQAPKRRKLGRRNDRHSSDTTSNESSSLAYVSPRRESVKSLANADNVHLDEVQGSGLVPSTTKSKSVGGGAVFEKPVSTSPSASTSVLDSKNIGIYSGVLPESIVHRAIQRTVQPPKSLNIHLQLQKARVSEAVNLQETASWDSSVVPKLPVHGQYRATDTAARLYLQRRSKPLPSTSNAITKPCGAVLHPLNKVTRSWTCHLPRASKNHRRRRDVRPSTTVSGAADSLIQTAGQHRTPSGDNTSTTRRIIRYPTALSQCESQAPLTQTSPSAKVPVSPSNDRSVHYLLNDTVAGYQRHLVHKRTTSLPNLPSRRHMSSMDPNQRYQPYALPTPPSETQAFPYQRPASNPLTSPAVATNMWNNSDNGSLDGLNPFAASSTPSSQGTYPAVHHPYDHSMLPNTFSPNNTMAYQSEPARHQHLASDRGFGHSSSQASFANGSMPQAPQQANGHSIQPKEYYSHTEMQGYINGCHQLWEARSQSRDAAYESQLSQERSQSRNLSHSNTQMGFDLKVLRLNLGRLQQEQADLKGGAPHDYRELYQRYHGLHNTLAYRDQEVAYLQKEIGRLQAVIQDLSFQMEKLAARPRPNATIAKHILQTLSRPNPVVTTTPGPSQAFLPQNFNSNTASRHENNAQPLYHSGYLEGQTISFNTRHSNPRALSTGLLPTSSVVSTSFADQSGSAAYADPHVMGNNVTIERGPVVPASAVVIDLTNDLNAPSSSELVVAPPPRMRMSFMDEQPEPERTPADLQEQAALMTAFNKKDFHWMDGLHPGRAIHTPGINFGLPSSKLALAAKAKEGSSNAGKINTKKRKDVMDALANHDTAQNEQSRNGQALKKRARTAVSQKKCLGNKGREQEGLSNQNSVTASGVSETQQQGPKATEGQHPSSESLAEDHHPVAQSTQNTGVLEEHSEPPLLLLRQAEEEQSGAARNPPMEDDNHMEVMHFPNFTINEDEDGEMTPAQFQAMLAAEADINAEYEDGAAKLEAMLTADAEADADSDDGGAAELQAIMEAEAREMEAAAMGFEGSIAATSANSDGPAQHDESESEEE